MKISAYSPRRVRCIDHWTIDTWRFKIYGISYNRPEPRAELVCASREMVEARLREHPTRLTHYNVGFIGIHDGRGENQTFLDFWVNENELVHWYVVSPTDNPTALAEPPIDHNSVCVWDLMVQCFERQAWIDCVLSNPKGPDVDSYLARRLDAVL